MQDEFKLESQDDRRKRLHTAFVTLAPRKVGASNGMRARIAKLINAPASSVSAWLAGSVPVPEKYVAALYAMPDLELPPQINFVATENGYRGYIDVPLREYNMLLEVRDSESSPLDKVILKCIRVAYRAIKDRDAKRTDPLS